MTDQSIHIPKIKVCGMRAAKNIMEVAQLQPNYIGFIFHEKSARFVSEETPDLPSNIIKTGVFVNQEPSYILSMVHKHNLGAVQLHGEESPELCEALKTNNPNLIVIKVFSVMHSFNFESLRPYEPFVNYFMFDTKGKLPGGNGYLFDWTVLDGYSSQIPFFLSGGIGPDQLPEIKNFMARLKAQGKENLLYAIDVNSRFETQPGVKDAGMLAPFIKQIKES